MFPAHVAIGVKLPQMEPGGFFPTNPDLANILGDTDSDFDKLHFVQYLLVPRFPDHENSSTEQRK